MKIGIYGGSFNPPHLGHMAAAESAAKYLGLDELLLIPAGIPPHKMLSADAAGADDRLAMTRLMGEQIALDTGVKVTVSDMEIARDVFGADDEIYNAILWHTTGKANMTLLEKVIYLADYIEPNRDFDGVEDLRKVVWEDLDKGLEMGLAMTVEEMEQMGNPVHHNTLQALEYLRGHTHE